MLNKEKMKAKCEAWIKEGMGACRAPITYDELLVIIVELEQAKTGKSKWYHQSSSAPR